MLIVAKASDIKDGRSPRERVRGGVVERVMERERVVCEKVSEESECVHMCECV